MRLPLFFLILFGMAFSNTVVGGNPSHVTSHIDIYKEKDRFAGWPANNGIWCWENEIVVGFTLGYHKEREGHTIDPDRPATRMQARSLDGGQTWAIETTNLANSDAVARATSSLSEPIDFSHSNFAARFAGGQFFYSRDRCLTWEGPFTLPTFGRPGLLARTDYLVQGKHQLTAFIAAQKESGGEGQPLCIRTIDGGQTWQLIGWIGPQPPSEYGYSIMPATVAIDGGYLSMIRRGGVFDGEKRWWVEAFLSPNDGRSWYMLDQPRIDNAGNPATLTRLKNGHLAMTYGWRSSPYGIRGRISKNEGQTWEPEFTLRADGRNWDLGYPRTVQRADGQLVTVYYFNDLDQQERYLAATIWNADLVSD